MNMVGFCPTCSGNCSDERESAREDPPGPIDSRALGHARVTERFESSAGTLQDSRLRIAVTAP